MADWCPKCGNPYDGVVCMHCVESRKLDEALDYSFRKSVKRVSTGKPTKTIVAAAIRLNNGIITVLPKPNRHHNIIHALEGKFKPYNQGFITSEGEFVDRVKAFKIAEAANQINYDRNGHRYKLFSEGVW